MYVGDEGDDMLGVFPDVASGVLAAVGLQSVIEATNAELEDARGRTYPPACFLHNAIGLSRTESRLANSALPDHVQRGGSCDG